METIIVKPRSKASIPFLKHLLSNLTDVASVSVVDSSGGDVLQSIERGLAETKEILKGKRKGKTLKSLLDEA